MFYLLFEKQFFSVKDKRIQFKNIRHQDDSNSIILINFILNFLIKKKLIWKKTKGYNNMKTILSNNKELLHETIQKLYDNIIIYFTNRNYFYEKTNNPEKTEAEFTINFHSEKKTKNKENQISEKLNKFKTFTDLTKNIFTAIKQLENLIELKDMQSNSFSIVYKIDYGGVFKDAKNNAIMAIAYSIFQFYNVFKEKTFIEQNDESYFDYLDAIKCYIDVCDLYKKSFNLIENFKFYDEQDLKAIANKREFYREYPSQLNLSEKEKDIGKFYLNCLVYLCINFF